MIRSKSGDNIVLELELALDKNSSLFYSCISDFVGMAKKKEIITYIQKTVRQNGVL